MNGRMEKFSNRKYYERQKGATMGMNENRATLVLFFPFSFFQFCRRVLLELYQTK